MNDTEESWVIAEGEHEGHRLIVRQSVGVRPLVGNEHYPYRVGIVALFKEPQEDGMPNEDELDILRDIEDTVYDYLYAKQTGVLCFVITTWGMRELVAYSKSEDIQRLVALLAKQFQGYEIQHLVEEDKDWDIYRQWDLAQAKEAD
jgi:hypothetical protein